MHTHCVALSTTTAPQGVTAAAGPAHRRYPPKGGVEAGDLWLICVSPYLTYRALLAPSVVLPAEARHFALDGALLAPPC